MGRASRVLQARIDNALVDSGVTLTELTALSVLAARPGLSNARLARRGLVTPQAMHKVIKSLEMQGLVARSATKGRSLMAIVTPEGFEVLQRLEPRLVAEEERFLRPLDDDQRERFIQMLTKVCGLPTRTD
jgi:DNA-binding MarR family transcriptional regulator